MSEIFLHRQMMQRCYNKSSKAYPRYGGRGILVDERWHDFATFLKDMGSKPFGMSLDRIDNDKGYSPENCRWATPKEQANNRRNNKMITVDSKTKTFAQWCDDSDLKPSTIRQRFYVYGWSIEESLWLPAGSRRVAS